MKNLFIVRHAKSSWEEPSLKDYDRPLKLRGVNDAGLMAERLVKKSIYPDHLISSPAIRALHTAVIYSRTLVFPFNRIEINKALYNETRQGILDFLKNTNPEINNLMIVGHDPVMTNLANSLLHENYEKIPTAGIVGISLDINSWSGLSHQAASLLFFDYPKNNNSPLTKK